jgi:replicative DNA helicase
MSDLEPMAIAEEEEIIGTSLSGPQNYLWLAVKMGLRAEHFYHPRHAAIFEAMMKVGLAKRPIDTMTVAAEVEAQGITPAQVNKLALSSGSFDPTARVERVIQVAERRHQTRAAQQIIQAAREGNDENLALALSQVHTSVRLETRGHDRIAASRDFADHLRSADPIETFNLPWKDLEVYSPGGFLRHHFISVIAWSGYGKSIMLDQMLTAFAQQGYSCGLYMTEMDQRERIARYVSAHTGISAAKLMLKNRLSDPERDRAAKWIIDNPLPFDPIDAEGWSGRRIREHALLNDYDCIAVDTVNNIPHRGREDFEDEIRTLASAAKIANCLTIGIFQLNQQRRDGISDPPPSLRDIRETGLVEHLSDRVVALHFENSDGQQESTGTIRLLKCRGGLQGGKVDIEHDRGHFRFGDKKMMATWAKVPDDAVLLPA